MKWERKYTQIERFKIQKWFQVLHLGWKGFVFEKGLQRLNFSKVINHTICLLILELRGLRLNLYHFALKLEFSYCELKVFAEDVTFDNNLLHSLVVDSWEKPVGLVTDQYKCFLVKSLSNYIFTTTTLVTNQLVLVRTNSLLRNKYYKHR